MPSSYIQNLTRSRLMHPPSGKHQTIRSGLLLALVSVNIALQLINASLLKYAAVMLHDHRTLVIMLLVVVIGLSFGRFAVWGAMHKRYPVSIAYPATALFFPCLVALSYVYGESVSTDQVFGAVFVSAGVLLLLRPSRHARGRST